MMKRIVILLLICLSNSWLFANYWTPNGSEYEDNMALTGVVCINGVEQQSTTLEVGVFCGEECRGSGLPTYFFPTQRYVVQLLVYGEMGDQLTFKLYDHDLGQELDLVLPDTVTFTADGYGSLSQPYALNFVGNTVTYYSIAANANPVEGGMVEGAGSYEEGLTCTLVATANESYAFTNWTEDGEVVSTNATYAFEVTSDRTLVANFIDNQNHWIPNEAGYEDNMTLTGVIQINGEEQLSTALEVGVFCDGECRGTGSATYFFPTQRYVIQLLIFGETGDQLTFKLYDHASGHELNLASPEAITFVTDGYGSLGDPYVLNFTGESGETTQTIELTQGWNWFSTSVEITLDDLKTALVESLPNATYIMIKGKDAATTYNGFRWRGQLNTLDVTQMYKIEIPTDCVITLQGFPINLAEHPIVVSNGANWIAFPLNEIMTIDNAFSGFAVSGDQVKGKSAAATFNGSVWRGTLGTLEPGQGYIYKSSTTEDRNLFFPTSAK